MHIPANLPSLRTFTRNMVFKTRNNLKLWAEYIQTKFSFNVFRYSVFNADNNSVGIILTYNF